LLRSAVVAALPTSALVVPLARAQDSAQAARPQPLWTLTALLDVLHAGADSWGAGRRSASAAISGPGGVSSSGRPCRHSTAAAAPPSISRRPNTSITASTEFGASLGATGFLVGDQSELTGGGVGLYLATHATGWLTRGFGLTAGANLRTAVGTFPGAYAGVALRF